MEPSLVALAVAGKEVSVSATLQFSETCAVRDLQHVANLFYGLLNICGNPVQVTIDSATKKARIDTHEFVLHLAADDAALNLQLKPTAQAAEPAARRTEALLAHLVRSACLILRPNAVRWHQDDKLQNVDTWLSAFRPFQPRRVKTKATTSRTRPQPKTGVAVWPNRPQDQARPYRDTSVRYEAPTADSLAARHEQWTPRKTDARANNRFAPEPLVHQATSWTLTSVTAALYPPAGAAMAMLNICKRANLRLNLHALTLTLVVLSLHQSGALDSALRWLGF